MNGNQLPRTPFSFLIPLLLATPMFAAPPTGNTGPGGFEATDASSALRLWLRGEDLTGAVGSSISTWADRSFEGNDAVSPATAPTLTLTDPTKRQVTIGSNTATVARFATGSPVEIMEAPDIMLGADATAESAEAANFTGFTVVGIYDIGAADSNSTRPMGFGTSLNDNRGGVNANNFHLAGDPSIRKDNGSITSYSEPNHPDDIFIRIATMDSSGVDDFFDGRQVLSSTADYSVRSDHFYIGDVRSNGRPETDVAEVVVYNKVLNDAERVVLENHLSAFYDIGLDTANGAQDVYAGDTGANGDFDLDVFGIGQDNSSQVSSAGSAGLGMEAISGSLDTDGEFIMAGHNVAINSLTTADVPAGIDERWDRTWFIDENIGGVDVDLVFDFSDAGLSPPLADDIFTLLFSATESPFLFSALTLTPTSVAGDVVTFTLLDSDSQFQNGYFTLGITALPVSVPEPSTFVISVLGLLGLGWLGRRRR